jgi:hypothetical protein
MLHGITLRNSHQRRKFARQLYPNHASFKHFALPTHKKVEDPLFYWATGARLFLTMFMCHTVPQAVNLSQDDYDVWSTLTNQAIVSGIVTFHKYSFSRSPGTQSEKYISASLCLSNNIGSLSMQGLGPKHQRHRTRGADLRENDDSNTHSLQDGEGRKSLISQQYW